MIDLKIDLAQRNGLRVLPVLLPRERLIKLWKEAILAKSAYITDHNVFKLWKLVTSSGESAISGGKSLSLLKAFTFLEDSYLKSKELSSLLQIAKIQLSEEALFNLWTSITESDNEPLTLAFMMVGYLNATQKPKLFFILSHRPMGPEQYRADLERLSHHQHLQKRTPVADGSK